MDDSFQPNEEDDDDESDEEGEEDEEEEEEDDSDASSSNSSPKVRDVSVDFISLKSINHFCFIACILLSIVIHEMLVRY